jgi:hypothetical protein
MNSTLSEIANWKLEAKLEDNHRYFFYIDEVNRIRSGEKCYVIGRKGTGKTAISEHINKLTESHIFTEKLTFKNFPFQDLYDLKSDSYKAPNQYIAAWKYLIYTFVCRMMARNEGISLEARSELLKIFDPTPIKSLRAKFAELTKLEFSVSILGTGGGVKIEKELLNKHVSLDQKAQLLEDFISKTVDDSHYYVIFDELDEDYRDLITKGRNNEYTDLLTSLFKAVQDIRSVFRESKRHIYPVIFLRDDIYDILSDPDKTKWGDLKIDLNWSTPRMQKLLAFRIARARNETALPRKFELEWGSIFTHPAVRMGHQEMRIMSVFDYISRSTLNRPRDYIKYLQVAAETETAEGGHKIAPTTVKKVDGGMSNYLRSELYDEMHGMIPDIDDVFDLISHIRKQTFWFDEFRDAFALRNAVKSFTVTSPESMCKLLFHFSLIGNQPRQSNAVVYKYLNREARFNQKEKIVVHRGLFKSLQIL